LSALPARTQVIPLEHNQVGVLLHLGQLGNWLAAPANVDESSPKGLVAALETGMWRSSGDVFLEFIAAYCSASVGFSGITMPPMLAPPSTGTID